MRENEHDRNFKRFLDIANRMNITYNEGKSFCFTRKFNILCYEVRGDLTLISSIMKCTSTKGPDVITTYI